jgi:hypothetical protein
MDDLGALRNALPDAQEQSSDERKLPKYYLNADSLLQQPLPRLFKGEHDIETISKPPAVRLHYSGNLARWKVFGKDAIKFYQDKRTKTELERCRHAPIYMDPKVRSLNTHVMVDERLQAGAEITLSARYFWNLLAVVLHIVETLANQDEHGQSEHSNFLPPRLTFGDSWIIEKQFRVGGQQPDVVLKLPTGDKDQIRMVGELKFCVDIGFESMIEDAETGDGKKFRGILGLYSQQLPMVCSANS